MSRHSQNCRTLCSVSDVEARVGVSGARGATRGLPAGHHLKSGTRASPPCALCSRQVDVERERKGLLPSRARCQWGPADLEVRGRGVLAVGN